MAPSSKFSINVAVRVRPLLGHDRKQETCVSAMSDNVVTAYDPEKLFPDGRQFRQDYLRENRTRERQYDFDHVFGPKSGQEEVFQTLGSPLIDVVLSGFNATVFAYGQTGSGKTHTMLGEAGEPGFMGRTLTALFLHGSSAKFNVSFIELYNEEIRDLLCPGNQSGSGPGLDLREDPLRGPQVTGVTEVPTSTSEAVMALVHQGNSRRRTEGTAANPVSSRSHALLQIVCEQKGGASAGGAGARGGGRNGGGGPSARGRGRGGGGGRSNQVKVSKLSLIDLAGSERAANTQNSGQRLVEGAMINRSLLALGNCINALSKKGMYVNFRDSKLTRLLKDSLGGNTRTAMIAHVSPSSASFEETLNTLKYAHRARSITSEVRVSWQPVKRRYGEDLFQQGGGGSSTARIRAQLESTAALMGPIHEAGPPKRNKGGGGGGREVGNKRPQQQQQQKGRKPVPPRAMDSTGPVDDGDVSTYPVMNGTMANDGEDNGDEGGCDDDDEDDDEEPVIAALDEMKETRKLVVDGLREQTNLKQSLMELNDQNTRNRIEISKLQVSVMHDGSNKPPSSSSSESGGTATTAEDGERGVVGGSRKGDKENGSAGGGGGDKRAAGKGELKRRKVKKDIHTLKKAIGENVAKKEEIKKMLAEAERSSAPHEKRLGELAAEVELRTREAKAAKGVSAKVQARLAAAEHEVSMLEVSKLELEQAGVVKEGELRERELMLHKLQLQVQLRDRALAVLVNALKAHPGVGPPPVNEVLRSLSNNPGPLEEIFKGLTAAAEKEKEAAATTGGSSGKPAASSKRGGSSSKPSHKSSSSSRPSSSSASSRPTSSSASGSSSSSSSSGGGGGSSSSSGGGAGTSRTSTPREGEDESEEEEGDDDDDDLGNIDGNFRDLAMSLRRANSVKKEKKAKQIDESAGESKRGDGEDQSGEDTNAATLTPGSKRRLNRDASSARGSMRGTGESKEGLSDDEGAENVDDDDSYDDYDEEDDGEDDGDDDAYEREDFEPEPPLESPMHKSKPPRGGGGGGSGGGGGFGGS